MMFMASVMLWTSSCGGGKDNSGDSGTGELSVTLRAPNVGSAKGSLFVSVTAQGEWSISTNQTWASVSPASGEGNRNNLILNYEANTETSPRTAVVTLTSVSGKKTSTAILTQEGVKASETETPSDKTNTAANGWLELPGQNITSGYKFISHDMAMSGQTVRSFSYYYSLSNLVAVWVAYPLNKSLIGSGGRTDSWGLDPKLNTNEQAILYSAYRGGYDRGHQLPSADRLNRADNTKTFYFTNMTPQKNVFNANIWGALEGKVRGWANACDTL